MSTILVDNFQVNKSTPIDNRFVVGPGQFYSSKNDITYKYAGLRVYDLSNSTFYYWTGTTFSAESFGGGGGTGDVVSGGSGQFSYIPRFTGGTSITTSQIFDNTFNIGFGTTTFGTEKYNFFGGDVKIESGVPGSPAQLRVDDGNSSYPTYTFNNYDDSGMYYNTSNNSVSFTVGGLDIQHISTNGVSIENGVLKLTDGLNSAPSYTFNNYDNSGMYYDTSKSSVSFAVNSTSQMHILNNVVLIGSQTPTSERLSLQSNSNTDATGALRIYSNNLTQDAQYSWGGINSSYYFKINSGGVQSITLNTGFEVTSSGYALISNGTNVSPGMAFINSPSTGIYAPTNGQLGVSVNTYYKMIFSDNDIYANIHQAGLNGRGDSGNSPIPWDSPSIASGQFASPLGQPVSNCSGVLPSNYTWMRVGNVVNVSGSISFFITTSGLSTSFRLSLPINSKFGNDLGGGDANNWQLNGVGKIRLTSGLGSQGDIASIEALEVSDIGFALFKFRPSVSGAQYMTYTYTYLLGSWSDYIPPAPPPPSP
jgi:hypothetical protein